MLALSFATLDLLFVKIGSLFSDSAEEHLSSQVGTFLKPLLEDVMGKKEGELALPVNANLGRAIKQAELFASAFMFPAYLAKAEADYHQTGFWDYYAIDLEGLEASLNAYLINAEEVLDTAYPDVEWNSAYLKLEGLLSASESAGDDLVAFKGKLRAEIQDELKAEILKAIDYPTLPPGLSDFIDSGWKMHGKHTGWFDIMVLKFADLLKMPENAKSLIAYQNRLHADIKIDTRLLMRDLKIVMDNLDELYPELVNLRKNWIKIERRLRDMGVTLDRIDTRSSDIYRIVQRVAEDSRLELTKLDQIIKGLEDVTVVKESTIKVKKILNALTMPAALMLERKAELVKLKDRLTECGHLLLLKGLGGSGKTELIRKYASNFQQDYEHIAVVEISENHFADPLVSTLTADRSLRSNFDIPEDEDEMRCFFQILQHLQDLPGKSLLILDNVNNSLHQHIPFLPMSPNWHTLITSRESLLGLDTLELEKFSFLEARQLFLSRCSVPASEAELKDLFEYIDFLPLLVELAAKNINGKAGLLSVAAFTAKLKESYPEQEVLSGFYSILIKTFRLVELEEPEKKILAQLYFLPPAFYELRELIRLFDIPAREEDHYAILLAKLANRGWLSINGIHYMLPKAIHLVVKHELKPDYLRDAQGLARGIMEEYSTQPNNKEGNG